MVITNFCGDFQRLRRIVKRDPIAAFHDKVVALQGQFISDDHAIGLGLQIHHVEWRR
jgi:hypothetical protein